VKGLLLDTSAFLLLALEDEAVSPSARQRLDDEPRFVSQICAVEIAIKHSIGKLVLPAPFQTAFAYAFDTVVSEFRATLLSLDIRHIETLSRLPLHHRDPFDRIIISQALAEEMTVVTRDRGFRAYDGLDTLQI
jgi:PIN domain nuclease of toxin-antitoxin system